MSVIKSAIDAQDIAKSAYIEGDMLKAEEYYRLAAELWQDAGEMFRAQHCNDMVDTIICAGAA